jgi:hypothetical protein
MFRHACDMGLEGDRLEEAHKPLQVGGAYASRNASAPISLLPAAPAYVAPSHALYGVPTIFGPSRFMRRDLPE